MSGWVQSILSGPEFSLRPLDPSDADSAPVWNGSAIARPPEIERERIEELLGSSVEADLDNQRLIIRRVSDDRPVGSVQCAIAFARRARIRFAFDPRGSQDDWADVCAGVIDFLVPWLLNEKSMMCVSFDFPGEHPVVEARAFELGMHRACRLRERVPYRGARLDLLRYEALHPAWVARLGRPRGIEEGSEQRLVARPAPLSWNPAYAVPNGAVVAGDRLYLRALTPEDAQHAARQMLTESEVSFPEGRALVNPWIHARSIRETARQEIPGLIQFAIVVGETGEPIGENGLIDTDLVARSAETETTIWSAEHRNKGYGTEAKHLLLEYAFDRLGLHMVYSWVSEFNTRSAAALRKQGYRDAGYIAWGNYHGTDLYGAFLFDLLAAEWRAARQ